MRLTWGVGVEEGCVMRAMSGTGAGRAREGGAPGGLLADPGAGAGPGAGPEGG